MKRAVKSKRTSNKSPKAKKPSVFAGRVPKEVVHKATSKKRVPDECCQNCSKDLSDEKRALFVEEEVGRIFCSEPCIAAYFTEEIKALEDEYLEFRTNRDFSGEEREQYAHLRWTTLQKPDEVWCEKTKQGDHRFTLISQFPSTSLQRDSKPRSVWCICICLFLRGEPSFLFLAFPTRTESLVKHYRKGERIEGIHREGSSQHLDPPTDRLGTDWSPEETLQAELIQSRKPDDIPPEQFELYQRCFEETLESPDEVWSLGIKDLQEQRLYHFVRYYPNEAKGMWYVIIARETDDEEEIEILDSFPTQDELLVHRYRTGRRELERERDQPIRKVLN